MANRVRGLLQGGLESWLVRKLLYGHLKDLPGYLPPRGLVGQSAERYARRLLHRLRKPDADRTDVERAKDDGRAFRTWVESMLIDTAV